MRKLNSAINPQSVDVTMGTQTREVTEEIITNAKKWKTSRDKSTGKTYYYHKETREVRWDKPFGFDESRDKYWKAASDGSISTRQRQPLERGDIDVVRDVSNPTLLFIYLQKKDWVAAWEQLRKVPREANIWVSCGICTPNKVTWKVLPLHAAIIIGAPLQLVVAILNQYPNAARRKDLNGSLPIHLAVCSISIYPNADEVMKYLLIAYPESKGVKDMNGHTPIKLLQHTQIWKDPTASQKRQRITEHLATESVLSIESEEEAIEIQLEIRGGIEGRHEDMKNSSETAKEENKASTSDPPRLSGKSISSHSSIRIPLEYWRDRQARNRLQNIVPDDAESQNKDTDAGIRTRKYQNRDDGPCGSTPSDNVCSFPIPDSLELSTNSRSLSNLSDVYYSSSWITSSPSEDCASIVTEIISCDQGSKRSDLEPNKPCTAEHSSGEHDCAEPNLPGLDSIMEHSKSMASSAGPISPPNLGMPLPQREGGIEKSQMQHLLDRVPSFDSAGSKAKMYFTSKLARYNYKSNKSRPESREKQGGVMQSKSFDGFTRKNYDDDDESYLCAMSAKTFPPYSIQEVPTMRPSEEKKRKNDEQCNANKKMREPNFANGSNSEDIKDKDDGKRGGRQATKESQDEIKRGNCANISSPKVKIEAFDEATAAISNSCSDLTQDTLESWQQIGLSGHLSVGEADNPLLFLSLLQKDWTRALSRISENPVEASVWIWQKARGYLIWRLLPLHAAIIIGAPSYLVLEILFAYPNAARERDMSGSLPIHLAASRIQSHPDGERILNHLIRAFPDSRGIEDGKGSTVIETARLHGVSIDSCSTLEPEEDFMLGVCEKKTKAPMKLSENGIKSILKSESRVEGKFMMESGNTKELSETNHLDNDTLHIEDDLESFKSGYIRITYEGV